MSGPSCSFRLSTPAPHFKFVGYPPTPYSKFVRYAPSLFKCVRGPVYCQSRSVDRQPPSAWPPTANWLTSNRNPPPVPARKTQRSGATFRRAVFSAKEVPGAQELSPRAQTHLPFGCSVVGVMWKPKASLNLQKKIFISRSVYGSWSAGCQNRPLVQWICIGLQICKRRFNPLYRATEVFLHFLSLDSATHRSFLHFLSLNLQKKIFISRSVYGSWSAVCQNRPLVQWICIGLQICKRRFNPLSRATEVFLHFLSLDFATHRSFLHFLSLNLQKKNFISRSVYGSWSAVCQNWPLVQWICIGLQICKRRFNPLSRATEVFLHFLSLGSATHRSFLHFLSLNLQKKKLFFFFPSKNKSERKVGTRRQMHRSGEFPFLLQ